MKRIGGLRVGGRTAANFWIFTMGALLLLRGMLDGFVQQGREWQTTVSVPSVSSLFVRMKGYSESDLKLTLVSPSLVEYTDDSGDKVRGLEVKSPEAGLWTVKVYGTSVATGDLGAFAKFSVTAFGVMNLVDIGVATEYNLGDLAGRRFRSAELSYIDTCAPGGLGFVMKAEEAGASDPEIDLEAETEEAVKAFLVSLALDNRRQKISLPLGGVEIDGELAKTQTGRDMLDADLLLKYTDIPEKRQALRDIYKHWESLVYASPYMGKIAEANWYVMHQNHVIENLEVEL